MTSRGKNRPKSGSRVDVTCDFASCEDYSPERMKVLRTSRSLLGESDLSVFSSGIRLGIVLLLLKMESACGCEIQHALNESRQPLISHHLRAMREAGWLSSSRWKRWTFYSLVPERKEAMMKLIQGYTNIG